MLEPSTGTSRRLEDTGSFPMSTRSRILAPEGGGEGEDDISLMWACECMCLLLSVSEPTARTISRLDGGEGGGGVTILWMWGVGGGLEVQTAVYK